MPLTTTERIVQSAVRASGLRNVAMSPRRLDRFAAHPRRPFNQPPPQRLRSIVQVTRREVAGWPVYQVAPRFRDDRRPVGTIVYFYGGGYVLPFRPGTHWTALSQFAVRTGRVVLAPIYPLAPEHTWRDVFPRIVQVYSALVHDRQDEPIAVAGDSSGGGLALALCLALGRAGLAQPQHALLLSPTLDLAMTNPAIQAVAKTDPILNPEHLRLAYARYADGEPLTNPLLSPVHVPLDEISARIAIFTGTNDVLNPDARAFRDRARNQGTELGYYEKDDAFHVWMFRPKAQDPFFRNVHTELDTTPANNTGDEPS